jgi:3-hydroxyacyl-CoA dehydrogenase
MNAAVLKRWLEQGELGRKSGRGFYAGPGPLFTKPGFIAGHEHNEE